MMSAEGDDDADNADDADEAMVSFEDEDDDMADLFSFGASSPSNNINNNNNNKNSPNKKQVDYSNAMASVMPLPNNRNTSNNSNMEDDDSDSEDSFIEMLEQQQPMTIASHTNTTNNAAANDYDDKDTQEILDWLEDDDDNVQQQKHEEEEEVSFIEPPPPPLPKLPQPPQPRPKPPEFKTLAEAVKSPKSTITQIRKLMEQEDFQISATVRPHLWCRIVCNKTLEETLQSSVADSFQHWEQQQQQQQQQQQVTPASPDHWIHQESKLLADRIAVVSNGNPVACQKALALILLNHYNTGKRKNDNDDDDGDENMDVESMDPLLPPVACAILSAGVPKVAAAVMLNAIVPIYMPILALNIQERAQAAHILHRQFYLVCIYHLPLLVLHLDRYLPDWYQWPPTGMLPQSWLVSHLAGECGGGGTFMNPKCLLSLWDVILASNNNSLRFFLVMAILEQQSDQLLLLTGETLKQDFLKIMAFKENETEGGFAIEAEDETTSKDAVKWVHEWSDRAQALWEQTPSSVIRVLKTLEDNAVVEALTKRQEQAEERLQRKLQAQAKAHQEAMETERDRKSDEARLRLTRARLVAFYRTYNPGKETNIDKIMTTYEGRYEVLDAKLKQKYGVGFNPSLKPKPLNKSTNKLLSTMNQGFGSRRPQFFGGKKKDEEDFTVPESEVTKSVVVTVAASEVLPAICWSKERNQARFAAMKRASKLEHDSDNRMPLKFYLVDSRPEEAALDQGHFPTSVSLSPETMLDPDKIKLHEDMFEALRGGIHIVIMGEGFSALPSLYGHKMTQGMYEHIKEDETRNNLCALFFIKKGFPFVSVLDGGFAAAHAWLCREGPKMHFRVNNALTDYNPEVSLFGQFERLHRERQGTGREKTQRAVQNLFDSSMTALTRKTMGFDASLASEVESGDTGPKNRQNVVSNFFGSSKDSQKNNGESNDESNDKTTSAPDSDGAKIASNSAAFLNPFAFNKQQAIDKTTKNAKSEPITEDSLVIESVDFDEDGSSDVAENNSNGNAAPSPRTPQNTFSTAKEDPSLNLVKEEPKTIRTEPPLSREQPKLNAFAGLGAAFNNTLKTANSKVGAQPLARNPFARFGLNANARKNADANTNDKKGVGISVPFGGFGQLRKNTVAMMKSTGSEGGGESRPSGADATVVEETMSFDQSSPAIAAETQRETYSAATSALEISSPAAAKTSATKTNSEGDKDKIPVNVASVAKV
jgi:hypothetical protein